MKVAGDSEMAVSTAAPPVDYFALFRLPERYAIDRDQLERRYLDRSREVHPDRFVGADAGQRVKALSATMQLNEAYKILGDDIRRAEYLLACRGLTIGGNEQLDPAFLMDVLEAREDLAAAQARGDHKQIIQLEDAMLDRKDAALSRVGALWAEYEAGEAAVLPEIKTQLILLRYVARYLEAASDDELD